jgi:hypothetical protein
MFASLLLTVSVLADVWKGVVSLKIGMGEGDVMGNITPNLVHETCERANGNENNDQTSNEIKLSNNVSSRLRLVMVMEWRDVLMHLPFLHGFETRAGRALNFLEHRKFPSVLCLSSKKTGPFACFLPGTLVFAPFKMLSYSSSASSPTSLPQDSPTHNNCLHGDRNFVLLTRLYSDFGSDASEVRKTREKRTPNVAPLP